MGNASRHGLSGSHADGRERLASEVTGAPAEVPETENWVKPAIDSVAASYTKAGRKPTTDIA